MSWKSGTRGTRGTRKVARGRLWAHTTVIPVHGDEFLNLESKSQQNTLVRTHLDPNYYCGHCGTIVTTESHRFDRDGRREHVFANPAGHVFTIGCFRFAEGCLEIGEATSDHSWFPGFTWSYAICVGCATHLGWYYSREGGEFFGLILAELIRP